MTVGDEEGGDYDEKNLMKKKGKFLDYRMESRNKILDFSFFF